jgi:hypothetical protein
MSLWGALTGSDAKKYAKQAYEQNQQQLGAGYDAMKGYYGQGYGDAKGYMQPFYQGGMQGFNQYQNLLGMNGAGAQGQAQQAYQGWNPYLSGDMDRAGQSVARGMATRGMTGSGMNLLAQQEATRRLGSQDFYNYNDRLQGLGQMGMQAGGQLGAYAMQNANNLSGAEQWFRGGGIQNQTNYANAQAAAGQQGLGNLIGLGGLALGGLNTWSNWGKK